MDHNAKNAVHAIRKRYTRSRLSSSGPMATKTTSPMNTMNAIAKMKPVSRLVIHRHRFASGLSVIGSFRSCRDFTGAGDRPRTGPRKLAAAGLQRHRRAHLWRDRFGLVHYLDRYLTDKRTARSSGAAT